MVHSVHIRVKALLSVVAVMLLQTLLSEMQSPSVADDSFLCIIMSCCRILLTSSTFGLSLTTKFDHMVCLSVCILCGLSVISDCHLGVQ